MKHYGVSVDEVVAATKDMNLNANGGVVYEYGNEYIVKGVLSTNNVERLKKALIRKNQRNANIPRRCGRN